MGGPPKQDAIDALAAALTAVGVPTSPPRPDAMRADLVVGTPDGSSVEVEVTAVSLATPEVVDRLAHWRGEGVVPVIVADEVPDSVRRVLDERDLSWLDRRGHLRLAAPGLVVDASFTPPDRNG
jgi:hypothetical protein